MSKAYRFDEVDDKGALVYFGNPEQLMGFPRQLLTHMGNVFPTIDLAAPEVTIEDYEMHIGHSDMLAAMFGALATVKATAKAYRLGKPEGYPDEDDLFLVLGEYEGQTFICFNGEDTVTVKDRGTHYSDVLLVPDAAEFFADAAALYA